MKYYIGIDLGGTNIKAGVVSEDFEIVAKTSCKTNLPRPAEAICKDISGATYPDDRIRETMKQCYKETGYVLDPHGACGYRALEEQLKPGEVGIFCETATIGCCQRNCFYSDFIRRNCILIRHNRQYRFVKHIGRIR